MPQGKTLEEINHYLLGKCQKRDFSITAGQKQSISELFQKEKSALLELPKNPYNNYKLLLNKDVDKYLTVKVKTNRYSVPFEYACHKVDIELGLYDVRITHKSKLIALHAREFDKHKWVIDPWHYIKQLRRKSRAFKTSRILTAIEEKWDPVVKQLWLIQVEKSGEYKGTKDFLDILLFFQDKDYCDMTTIFEIAIENSMTNQEAVKMLYQALMEEKSNIEDAGVEHLAKIANFTLPAVDLDKFDTLMEVANG